MTLRALALCWGFAVVFMLASPQQSSAAFLETPNLEDRVKAGDLPPVAKRVPEEPRVINLGSMGREAGKHGGTMHMLMGKQKDIRAMSWFGYARLVGYTQKLELVPDILKSFDVKEGRIFTFHLRKGHKWSDGHPFTAEAFRYAWEDVLTDKDIRRGRVPVQLQVDGKPPKFEVIDELTVRYTWEKPNPEFLASLAAPRPVYLAMPGHYLKQFHKKYQDPAKLEELVKANSAKNWRGLHISKSRQYRPENPELPSLEPWLNTTTPPSELFVFKRNPYFHRVDENGRQLPYVNQVNLRMGSTQLIPAKTGTGESSLQARYLRFDNFTFLKENAERNKLTVLLWRNGFGSALALLPNLNTKDPNWGPLLQDVRVRRALSIAINREELNEAVFLGLGAASADTVLEESPLFKEEYRNAWAQHDPDTANKLLDKAGLSKRDSEGFRLLPNGERADLIVETAGESTEQSDMLQLITDHFAKVGIKMFTRASQRDVLRRRVFSGQTVMSVWTGLDNAVPSPAMSPWELAPSSESQLQWPIWGQYFETKGNKGEKPTDDVSLKLAGLAIAWRKTEDEAERRHIWSEMLSLYTDNVYSIGTVNATRQPVVHKSNLKNVPEVGIYSYEPGAFFGMYLMDTFWFDGN